MSNIRKLETELWESADLLRAGSKLTSNQYCMPVLGLIFLRYAYSRFKKAEAEILQNRPSRGGRVMPVEASDFAAKSALFLPKEAQYEYLVNLPSHIPAAGLINKDGHLMNSLGEVVNNAMLLIEDQSEQLVGILPKSYADFPDELLSQLLRIFNNSALDDVGGDIIGRIYEYFLNKFAKNIAQDDGVFFTPKSLVKMIVNILEPKSGILLDPACGSGGMFIQSGDFVNAAGMNANSAMTFYGQEKVEYNAQLCLMNMAVHGLTGIIKSGDAANTFYHDAHNLDGCCDYVMANPPFNVDKVNAESCTAAGRLPFGLPSVNKSKEVGNANYLWISYFYSYLNEHGRAGFVMASSSTDSQGKDRDIREQLVRTGNVDVMISVGNNFFYTKSLPCSLWFFDKAKKESIRDKVLFLDARNYYTVIDRTLNEWTDWQLKNLNAIVWLYRGENEKYCKLIKDYTVSICLALRNGAESVRNANLRLGDFKDDLDDMAAEMERIGQNNGMTPFREAVDLLEQYRRRYTEQKSKLEAHVAAMKKDEAKTYLKEHFGVTTWSSCKKILASVEDELFRSDPTDPGELADCIRTIREYDWLQNNFPDDEYRDVPGLCKVAGMDEIEAKGWSLTPGAYVGVAPVEGDGVDFAQRMREIHEELLNLQAQSNELMETISRNMKELRI